MVPVVMIEHLETQAKNINDVLLTIQKNQTSNRLAKQQMEIIAALNRNNEKTALELEKKPKIQPKRKALKEKKKHQETKARWNAKRTKTELAAAADAAQVR